MKLKDLLELADGDTFLQLVDVNSEQYIEADADNSLIQLFSEMEVKEIWTSGTVYIKIQK